VKPATTVHYQRRGAVAKVELRRPDQANAIDPPTFDALAAAYHRADHDEKIRVVVLCAAGPDFSIGLDPQAFLPELQARGFSFDGGSHINPFGTTTRLSKPLVVALQGTVGSMANELLLAADIRVAAEDTVFSQGEVSRGTSPAGGGSIRLPLEIGWGNAMRWILTGESWDAAEALRVGLVQEVAPTGSQLTRALELAETIAAHPPLAVRRTLGAGRRAVEGHAHYLFADLLPTLYDLMDSEDFAERMAAMREGRKPTYVGR
jgi:enoyl-CoA hydratase